MLSHENGVNGFISCHLFTYVTSPDFMFTTKTVLTGVFGDHTYQWHLALTRTLITEGLITSINFFQY